MLGDIHQRLGRGQTYQLTLEDGHAVFGGRLAYALEHQPHRSSTRIEQVHGDLHDVRRGRRKSARLHGRETAARFADAARNVPGNCQVTRCQGHVIGDERRPSTDRRRAGPADSLRTEIRRENGIGA